MLQQSSNDVAKQEYKRHWSFIVCDKKYLYPFVAFLMIVGIAAAILLKDVTQISRVGNFVIGTGVWMTMRYTLREGINRHKDILNLSPTIPGPKGEQFLNAKYINNMALSIGDAQLQIHGFCLVLFGSFVGSYGDIIFSHFARGHFDWVK